MSSDKRDFKNFEEFPGGVNADTGVYEFPDVCHEDSRKRMRIWKITLRLVKKDAPQAGVNWDLLAENQVPIKPEYYSTGDGYTDIPRGTIVQVWTETGILGGKITRNSPTYINDSAFVGQSNQRNPFQQGLIYARGHYLKKKQTQGTCRKRNAGQMYFPMLAHPWDKGHKRLVYPLYGQPKLDGARCLCYLKAPDTGPEQVVIYTRTLKLWPSMEYLQEVLYPYLNDLYDREAGQSIYLDGELYRHGVSLQEISGVSRNGKRREFSELNQYHIYDCFYPHEMSTPFSARLKQLRVLGKAIKDSDPLEGVTNIPDGTHPSKIVHIVPTVKVKDYKDGCKKFQAYIAKGYEGMMLRLGEDEGAVH